jgi:adenosylmethionine---8-amino-7-oxononanoate aminotransferase
VEGTQLDALLAFDREHVWHPYGALPGGLAPLPVVSAQGVRLKLADGRELIDGMASWWCAIHGYRHPVLDRSVGEQLQRMAHVMFGGLTHEPGVRLAERLLALAPQNLQAVFFADSGSVSVEVAIKLALQFQRARGRSDRTRLLTVRGGYHGDTFGAMAVCDPIGGMHSMFAGVLAEHVFAERPPDGFAAELDERWAAHVRELVARHADELAAIVVEPVV